MKNTNETGLSLLQKEQPTLAQLILISMPQGSTIDEANRVAIKEISNFEVMLQTNPSLSNCSAKSVVYAVKQCINDGLTLAPSAGLAYLLPTKVKVGIQNNQDVYEWAVNYDPTANGRLSIAYQSGAILDHKRPYFTFDSEEKLDTVTFEILVPSFKEPRWEVITFGKMHFKKWADACAKKNGGKLNPNYTSWNGGIDPEFASTKAIRHGLAKRGTNLNGKRSPVPSNVQVVSKEAIEKEKEELMDDFVRTNNGKVEVTTVEVIDEKGDLPV